MVEVCHRWLIRLVVLAVAGMAGYWYAAHMADARSPNAPATTQPAVTTAPAKDAEKYPDAALAARCRAVARTLKGKLDDTFAIEVSPPFILAGNMTPKRLKAYAEQTVLRPAELMWATYFDEKPDEPITILLFTGDKSYRAWAKKLFGDTDVSHFGYYRPGSRTLVMNIATGGGTLVHELTHALIAFDFPDVPTWFNEGLASLHEQCAYRNGRVVGLVNWRLPGLQRAIARGKYRPLREMIDDEDFYGKYRGLNYAQARYFVMYMQQQGVLEDFYALFREDHTDTDAAVATIEMVFGEDLDTVERNYLAWVKTLKYE